MQQNHVPLASPVANYFVPMPRDCALSSVYDAYRQEKFCKLLVLRVVTASLDCNYGFSRQLGWDLDVGMMK